MFKIEEWRDIKGFEGCYQISNLGNVKSFKNPKEEVILGKRKHHKGYIETMLCEKSKQYIFKVHRLVAIAFIPNPENKPTVNHEDGDKLNNNDWNLKWSTYAENNAHAVLSGLNNKIKNSSLKKEIMEIKSMLSKVLKILNP